VKNNAWQRLSAYFSTPPQLTPPEETTNEKTNQEEEEEVKEKEETEEVKNGKTVPESDAEDKSEKNAGSNPQSNEQEAGEEVEKTDVDEDMPDTRQEKPEEGEGGTDELNDYYFCDNSRHVEYLAEMVRSLQSLSWRRFDVQFGGKVGPHIHDMWLKKKGKIVVPQWILAYDATQSDTVVDLLVRILIADHSVSLLSAPSSL